MMKCGENTMGFWKDLMERALIPPVTAENPAASSFDAPAPAYTYSYAGEDVNAVSALQVPPYTSALTLLAGSLAKLSKHVMKGDSRAESHPVERLLDNPNPFVDGFTFFQQAEMERLNNGNAYIHITRNGNGTASALMLLHHSNVMHKVENGQFFYQVRQGSQYKRVEPADMIHVKTPFTNGDAFKGLGYHGILQEQLSLWLAAQRHQARYFSLGSDPTSVLTTEEMLSEEKRDLVRQAWERLNGNENRHRVAVLDGGFKFHRMGSNFGDLEMNAMFGELTKQIASAFNLAPYLIGHDGSKNTYANIESQSLQFLQQSLLPNIIAWEKQLAKLFGKDSSYYIKFNYETLLRADSKSRADRLTALVQADIITVDEAREFENMAPKEGDALDSKAVQQTRMQRADSEEGEHGILRDAPESRKPAI